MQNRNLSKEVNEKNQMVDTQTQEINEMRHDLQQQVKQNTKLEKEKLHLTLSLEQSTKKCSEIQSTLAETKEELQVQSLKAQNLND